MTRSTSRSRQRPSTVSFGGWAEGGAEFLSIFQFLRRAPRQDVQADLHTEADSSDTTFCRK